MNMGNRKVQNIVEGTAVMKAAYPISTAKEREIRNDFDFFGED